MPTFRQVVTLDSPVLGGTGTNTWHARTSETLPINITSDLDEIQGWLATFYTAVGGWLVTDTVMHADGIWTEVMPGDPDEPLLITGDPWTLGGAGGTGALPPHAAICVGWRAASGGRSGRGRTFLGPLADTVLMADGTIDDTVLTAVRAAAQALVDTSTGFANGALGIFSRDADGAPPAPVFRDFVSTVTRDQFASLRSRRD